MFEDASKTMQSLLSSIEEEKRKRWSNILTGWKIRRVEIHDHSKKEFEKRERKQIPNISAMRKIKRVETISVLPTD